MYVYMYICIYMIIYIYIHTYIYIYREREIHVFIYESLIVCVPRTPFGVRLTRPAPSLALLIPDKVFTMLCRQGVNNCLHSCLLLQFSWRLTRI